MPDSISSCGLLIGAPTQHHLTTGADDAARTAVLEFHADRPVSVEHHLGHGRFGEHRQVLPLERGLEVCVGGAPPGAPALGDRVSQKPSGAA